MNTKRLVASIVSLIIVLALTLPMIAIDSKSAYAENPKVVEQSKSDVVIESFQDIQYVAPTTKEEALSKQHEVEKYIFTISDLVYISTTMEEYNLISGIINEEVERARAIVDLYKIDYDNFVEAEWNAYWNPRLEEYPVATRAWLYMKELGWSDTMCAGIMGNLMLETGGGTLNLDWDSNGSSGYGLVQWIGGRRAQIKSIYGEFPTVENQIQFIHDELYGVNGVRRQVSESQLNAIANAESPEECAYAFACYYERCSVQHRAPRRGYARNAYNYFVE